MTSRIVVKGGDCYRVLAYLSKDKWPRKGLSDLIIGIQSSGFSHDCHGSSDRCTKEFISSQMHQNCGTEHDRVSLPDAWFPACPEPMAYRRPRGLTSSQIAVLVASFFVALGAGTNYVRWLASLLNNWTPCSLDIFRCMYSLCFSWMLADPNEFHICSLFTATRSTLEYLLYSAQHHRPGREW